MGEVARGLAPRLSGESLYIAIGMLGATVMPHNLYLHSAIVPKCPASANPKDQRRVLRKCFSSTASALTVALLMNAAILIVAGSVFHTRQITVTDLGDAHALLTPLLGTSLASVLFAVALLCSGQSSTITGTLAGQAVMEGFLRWRIPPVARRAVTRALAIIPAVTVLGFLGEGGTMLLLIASQVVLSLQLPFAVVPLVRFTSSAALMGRHANSTLIKALAVSCAVLVSAANAVLVSRIVASWHVMAPRLAYGMASVAVLAGLLLAWISLTRLRGAPRDAGGSRDRLPGTLELRS
jgi:manganese transport protein